MKKRAVLCILDGWGIRPTQAHDGATQEATFFSRLWEETPHTLLEASGPAVGLAAGQPGNSEVGHTLLGLGHIPLPSSVRLDQALEAGTLLSSPAFVQALQKAAENGGSLHLWGLLSTGGVHSHARQWKVILNELAERWHLPIWLHVVLDGRDVDQKSGQRFLEELMTGVPDFVRVASLCGRFYAMDRDQRWDRTEVAARLVAIHQGSAQFATWQKALHSDTYKALESDEFFEAVAVGDAPQASPFDVFLSLNYRADRARQMVQALGDPARMPSPRFAHLFSLVNYADTFRPFCTPLLKKASEGQSLGEVLSQHHQTQLRLAESEKYAHVTFFLNGGLEAPFKGEDRVLIPSPKVETYNQTPKMQAEALTQRLLEALRTQSHDVIVINYANADMLGHTGDLEATKEAVRCLDVCLKHVVEACQANGYDLIITADHGNAEQMRTSDGTPHTFHTINRVPFLLVSTTPKSIHFREGGTLADVAPTLLAVLGHPAPSAMTGRCLWEEAS